MLRDLSKGNKVYSIGELDEKDVDKNPIVQFINWLDFAEISGVEEPNAMILSTVDENSKPSSRVVLLKNILEDGLVFYTNFESRKGRNISINPNVSAVFFWSKLERQVRVEGTVIKHDKNLSDAYFKSRPYESRLGAISSPQSQVIPSRDYLIELIMQTAEKYKNEPLNRPDYWGGFLIQPNLFEFWQGRPNRINDRIQYRLDKNSWVIERLAP
ncbi:MAG: pyridoxamine 5'-phosphate oxidase [Bacteroidales bacterium]